MLLTQAVFTIPRLLLALMAPPVLGFAFLAALAPAIFKGIQGFFQHKAAGSAAKKAESADLARQKAEYERYQGSPEAVISRIKATARLGRILGALGGREHAPPSLLALYDRLRGQQAFTAVPGYAPRPGGWDIAGKLAEAATYYNPNAGEDEGEEDKKKKGPIWV